jgi:hypothetical protein
VPQKNSVTASTSSIDQNVHKPESRLKALGYR